MTNKKKLSLIGTKLKICLNSPVCVNSVLKLFGMLTIIYIFIKEMCKRISRIVPDNEERFVYIWKTAVMNKKMYENYIAEILKLRHQKKYSDVNLEKISRISKRFTNLYFDKKGVF